MPYEIIWHDMIPEGPWAPGWAIPLLHFPSKHFLEHVAATRPPITVIVPLRGDQAWEAANPGQTRGTSFCVDAHPTNDPDGGWEVTIEGPMVDGERLLITVKPSINAVGIYHGWITDGVLSDDIGG